MTVFPEQHLQVGQVDDMDLVKESSSLGNVSE